MRRTLMIIGISGVGLVPVVLKGFQEPQQAPQVSQEEVITWRMAPSIASTEVGAQLQSSVSAVRPYFDVVRLERSTPTGVVNCGNFPFPVLSDNGVNRSWIYTMQRPSVGACAERGSGDFVAVGIKGGTELRAQSAP